MAPIPHQHAVVTGASSGIGLAIAQALLGAGVRVSALCRSTPPLGTGNWRHFPVDLTDRRSLEAILDELGQDPPDLWINNAGSGLLGGLLDFAPSRGDALLELLLHVPIRCSQWFAQRHRSPPPGLEIALVQVSSLAAELPIPRMALYNAAKAGLSAFSASLSLDRELPLRVIDFRPGDFNTPFIHRSGMADVDEDLEPFLVRLQKHHQAAPDPEVAARALLRALSARRSGIVRTGPFFQRAIAPLGVRFLPQQLLHRLIRRYYGL